MYFVSSGENGKCLFFVFFTRGNASVKHFSIFILICKFWNDLKKKPVISLPQVSGGRLRVAESLDSMKIEDYDDTDTESTMSDDEDEDQIYKMKTRKKSI